MRESYLEELDDIRACLVEMANAVGSQMSTATTALLDADVALADLVIAGDEQIDATRESIEQRCFTLLARQQPVATDLRTIVVATRIASDLERMGDLAEHIAKVARMRFPDHAVPQEVRPAFLEAGHVAEMLVAKAGTVIATRDVEAAHELETDDDAMDRLHRGLFRQVLSDGLALRHRGRHRHHPARPLLRALRRPRGQRRPPRRLPGDRRAARPRNSAITLSSSGRHRGHVPSPAERSRRRLTSGTLRAPLGEAVVSPHFFPWFLTASIAAAAASGSRYCAAGLAAGRRSSSRS